MKNTHPKTLAAGVVATLGAVSQNADAGMITFHDPITDYLSGNNIATGSFDINGFLSDQHDAGNQVDIASAILRVYGYSSEQSTPTQYQQTGGYTYTYSYSYSCGWWGYSTCYSYRHFDNRVYDQLQGDGEEDVLLVDFGDQQVTDSTQNADVYVRSYNYYYTYYNSSYYYYSSSYVNRRYNVIDRNDHGELFASLALSDFSLNDLTDDGILGYTARATQGHVNYGSLFLDVTFNLTPVAQAVSASSGLLIPLGMAAVAALRRRQPKLTVSTSDDNH